MLFLTIAIVIMAMFSSCEKDKSIVEEIKLDPTEQKILNFKEQMQNPNKSDEAMSIDSAVWYIEAALNYTYCYITEEKISTELNGITADSTMFDYTNSNDLINIGAINNIYESIKTSINLSFNILEYDVKFYDLVDVKYVDNKFKIYYTFVYNEVENYDKTQVMWISAPPIIYSEVNKNVAYPTIGSGYFTDVDVLHRSPFWHFETTTNPYGDYLIFYQRCSYNTPMYYIGDAEMNYYFNHADDALALARSGIPIGYTFKSWTFRDWGWYYNYYGYHYRAHHIYVYYGIRHAGGGSQTR